MGVSTSPEQLVAKLERSARNVRKASMDTLRDSADVVRTSVLAQAAGEIGADLAFSGTGRAKRVGVSTKVAGDQAQVKATGPMHWLERGVKPHAIVSKKFGRTRSTKGGRKLKGGGVSEAKLGTTDFVSQAFGSGLTSLSFGAGRGGALRFASGEFRPYARKAGRFTARQSWSKGVNKAEPLVRRRFRVGVGDAALAPFR